MLVNNCADVGMIAIAIVDRRGTVIHQVDFNDLVVNVDHSSNADFANLFVSNEAAAVADAVYLTNTVDDDCNFI